VKNAGLLLTADSLGAGSYTGIEAVSNGLPILREPRVATGRRTMIYMGVSLAFMVAGLLLMYQIYNTLPKEGTGPFLMQLPLGGQPQIPE
jgi:hypothetical protein